MLNRTLTLIAVMSLNLILGSCGGGGSSTTTRSTLPSLSITAASAQESTGNLVFTVAASKAATADITVHYTTSNGTALAGNDYTAIALAPLTITAGQTSSNIIVTILDDTSFESNETLTVTLSNLNGATMGSATATGTIINDDPKPVISIANATIVEGNVGTTTLNLTVSLSAISLLDTTITYLTSDGTATTVDGDYTVASSTMTILAGSSTGVIPIIISGDYTAENNQDFTVTISQPTNATLGTPIATVTILNDDAFGLNDTGINLWGNASLNNISSFQGMYPGQDADFGRDSNNLFNNSNDGTLGFSFTKLDSNGIKLSNQLALYNTTPWSCIQDDTTGLIWEVKTPLTQGLHGANHTYSWYNSTGINNAGQAGTQNAGTCNDTVNCDTEKYVAQVSNAKLCGFSNWRLPTKNELISILNYKTGGSDPDYFPHGGLSGGYWSSSQLALAGYQASSTSIIFSPSTAGSEWVGKNLSRSIRLVRNTP